MVRYHLLWLFCGNLLQAVIVNFDILEDGRITLLPFNCLLCDLSGGATHTGVKKALKFDLLNLTVLFLAS